MSDRLLQLEAFEVTVPLPRPLQLAAMRIVNRQYVLVRATDGGGRCGMAIGLSRSAPVAEWVRRCVAPHLKVSAEDYQPAYDRCLRANVPLGTNGIFHRALSLADIAVHDLLRATPVCRCMGFWAVSRDRRRSFWSAVIPCRMKQPNRSQRRCNRCRH